MPTNDVIILMRRYGKVTMICGDRIELYYCIKTSVGLMSGKLTGPPEIVVTNLRKWMYDTVLYIEGERLDCGITLAFVV